MNSGQPPSKYVSNAVSSTAIIEATEHLLSLELCGRRDSGVVPQEYCRSGKVCVTPGACPPNSSTTVIKGCPLKCVPPPRSSDLVLTTGLLYLTFIQTRKSGSESPRHSAWRSQDSFGAPGPLWGCTLSMERRGIPGFELYADHIHSSMSPQIILFYKFQIQLPGWKIPPCSFPAWPPGPSVFRGWRQCIAGRIPSWEGPGDHCTWWGDTDLG